MKAYLLFIPFLTLCLVSCSNNADKGFPEEKVVSDSSVVENTENATVSIEEMLDSYEIIVGEVREKFFIDGKYQAPPGHQYHTEIHPAVQLYEVLKSRQEEMTPEQLARFRRLTKKIREVF